jgi:hypothetical protein
MPAPLTKAFDLLQVTSNMSTPMSTAKRRQGQDERTTTAICGDKRILFSASTTILFFLLHSHRRANIWGLRAPQANTCMYGKLFPSARIVGLVSSSLHTEQMGVRVVTRARVYGAVLQRLLPATSTTKHIHIILRTAARFSRTTRLPDTQCMQVSSPCHARRLSRHCQPFLFLGVFPLSNAQAPAFPLGKGSIQPCFPPRPLLCSGLVRVAGLMAAGQRPGISRFSIQYSLEELTRPPLIAIEPYSHSRHASNYLSHPTATSPRSLLCTQAGTCISPR